MHKVTYNGNTIHSEIVINFLDVEKQIPKVYRNTKGLQILFWTCQQLGSWVLGVGFLGYMYVRYFINYQFSILQILKSILIRRFVHIISFILWLIYMRGYYFGGNAHISFFLSFVYTHQLEVLHQGDDFMSSILNII